jgi:benzoyl-CoA reductase/2-hydroxyglutaryl-CoA dehydratase subunit BcrC/BadD/HgdB
MIDAINLHNKYRSTLRDLARLRKEDPPLITGEEFTRVLVAGMSIPVEEAIELTTKVIEEFKQRGKPETKKPRLMIVGAQVDDSSFIKLVEDAGAYVVADDLCPGAREFMSDVDISVDPIQGIAERYLRKIRCSRTNRELRSTYEDYQDDRFGHMGRSVKEYKVDGVIFYFYKYCDPFGFDVPAMKSYVESQGVPVLYLEDEYTMSAAARLVTRIQVFLEMIASGK